MSRLQKNYCLWFVLIGLAASSVRDESVAASDFGISDLTAYPEGLGSIIITDVYATGYFCVYNSQQAGSQTITRTISNNTFILKTSFLFGGRGVAMPTGAEIVS